MTAPHRLAAFLSPRESLATAAELAHRAETLGYDSVWLTHGVGRDGFLSLATYAHATKRIGLGTGVIPIYPRHPVAMAQEAATFMELSGGRLRLGRGSRRPLGAELAFRAHPVIAVAAVRPALLFPQGIRPAGDLAGDLGALCWIHVGVSVALGAALRGRASEVRP